MSIYISGMILPPDDRQDLVICIQHDGTVLDPWGNLIGKAIEVPPHGRLGDLDEIWELLKAEKYPETQIDNETDHDDRYWMIGKNAGINAFTRVCKQLQTIIPADRKKEERIRKEDAE